jgi:hypothetical protein
MKKYLISLLILVIGIGLAACTFNWNDNSGDTGGDSVIVAPTPVGSPSPSASPKPSGNSALVSYLRVGPFGGTGCTANNGVRPYPLAATCTAFVTATPKHADGTDATPEEHGTQITWSATGAVQYSVQSNPFNSDVKASGTGAGSVTARLTLADGRVLEGTLETIAN